MGTSSFPSLPAPRQRRLTGGSELREIAVSLVTMTPILGGATATRTVDEVNIIRVPSIRGQLRFWWRVLYGHTCKDAKELSQREGDIWGRMGGQEGARSVVEARVTGVEHAERDDSDIGFKHPAAYALWPARATTKNGVVQTPPAPRWNAGLSFQLVLRVAKDRDEEVRRALRAWILFGGYGGRPRRGCGSLTVAREARAEWLPSQATSTEMRRLLGDQVLGEWPTSGLCDLPSLHGAVLHVGKESEGDQAWLTALGWLRDFRQGPARTAGDPKERFARERPQRAPLERPGRSNWPEPDKIRLHSGAGPWAHQPRHNREPAWPRASFGLPLLGRFQSRNRDNLPYTPGEPAGFEIGWARRQGGQSVLHDRLASPLILKPMPLANGRLVPIALWLCRAYPSDGQVVLVRGKGKEKEPLPKSEAPFDRLVAPGDTALFAPLKQDKTMREAFAAWLLQESKATKV